MALVKQSSFTLDRDNILEAPPVFGVAMPGSEDPLPAPQEHLQGLLEWGSYVLYKTHSRAEASGEPRQFRQDLWGPH